MAHGALKFLAVVEGIEGRLRRCEKNDWHCEAERGGEDTWGGGNCLFSVVKLVVYARNSFKRGERL